MTPKKEFKDSKTASRYVVVTPVRDEELYIEIMIKSVLEQLKKPDKWVIVDDGSTDQTSTIIATHTQGIDWITVLKTKSTQRNLGSAEITAFNKGIDIIKIDDFDFIIKLDGDVKLEPNYFQEILGRMVLDPKWGVTSGVYCEKHDDHWAPVKMPPYHAAGASKVVKRECYEMIGGFVDKKGWDTLDEIRAELNGWKVGHFEDIQFKHLKPEGIVMGRLSTHFFHGEIYYQTGGGLLFLFAKGVHRMVLARPLIIGGLTMIAGYLMSLVKRKQRLVNKLEARFYRNQLNKRFLKTIIGAFQFNNPLKLKVLLNFFAMQIKS
ncbi:MAG: glycosyltransferase family A protein [Methylococcaceae bacterium]|jgi:poly-beta-1,6-N-acetyl-D-glucosamine synthase